MYRQIKTLLLLIALITALPLEAQELSVKSMELAYGDAMGSQPENLMQDTNGNNSGLLRVYLAAPGAKFEGWVLRQEQHNASEYWVVMAKDSRHLKVVVPGYLPMEIDFRDYGITGIESLLTYNLTIVMPQSAAVPQDDGMRFLTMKVEPKNSTVFIDNTQREVAGGEVSVYLPMGQHTYTVSAAGYAQQSGTVNLTDNTPTEVVRLTSTRATLRVECATQGAQVYVGGQQRGTAPWSGSLDAGNYKVEVRRDGYRTQQQSVTLNEKESRTLQFNELQQIVGRLVVNYRPIGCEVLIDGNKIGTSPNVFRDVPVGSHRVEIRKAGYQPFSQSVTVRENEQSDLTGTLTSVSTSSATNTSSSGITSGTADRETFTVNGVQFTMVRVDGGTFKMGADKSKDSDAYDDESPVHDVTLSTYMIGETEVTQALWQAVMGSNPSNFTGDQTRPVEQVSWDDCQEFVKKLNSLTGKSFRLPTEAEWEYAARGGNKSRGYKYSGSNSIDDVAWYTINSNSQTHPVGKKRPNELGLYDMTGNVLEWCSDWYGVYRSSSQTNPKGAVIGLFRVIRGGSWNYYARNCRSSFRISRAPDYRINNRGFRLAL